jgi:cholesterol oxidase
MSELEKIPITWRDEDGAQPKLFLRRRRNGGRPAVLLLHGVSARHETFLIPPPDPAHPDVPRNLVDWLHERGFEPWLLDWRGSGLTVDRAAEDETLERLRSTFDFDHVARFDIPAALRTIEASTRRACTRAVGHCMGAASLAQAIASGQAPGLEHVVLLTIGLFYEPAWDGRLKTQDHALERVRLEEPDLLTVDPRPGKRWPRELEEIYGNWPDALRPHPGGDRSETDEVCNRLSFMYGPIYLEENLFPELHEQRLLLEQFGGIPLPMYLQAARNARRGWAAGFDANNEDVTLIGPEARAFFDGLSAITLVTGVRNQVWHRDSIDRMYEWLRRGPKRDDHRVHKEIVPDYAHQDLLWGERAHRDVFPSIEQGLRATPAVEAAGVGSTPSQRRGRGTGPGPQPQP